MFSKMKHRFKKLGFISIELVILASVMLTAGGYGVAKLGSNMSNTSRAQDELFNAVKQSIGLAGESKEQTAEINRMLRGEVDTLYDKGESRLKDKDIVTISGIECYVLEFSEDMTKAKLITKEVYDARFDTGGHNADDVEGHVGYLEGWETLTYDYKYSTLRNWMFNFYKTQLNADPRIIPSDINYYTGTQGMNISEYSKGTLIGEYVYPLDGKEAYNKSNLFNWPQKGLYSYAFSTTAGYLGDLNGVSGYAFIWRINHNGSFNNNGVNHEPVGARPVFWITLE